MGFNSGMEKNCIWDLRTEKRHNVQHRRQVHHRGKIIVTNKEKKMFEEYCGRSPHNCIKWELMKRCTSEAQEYLSRNMFGSLIIYAVGEKNQFGIQTDVMEENDKLKREIEYLKREKDKYAYVLGIIQKILA